MIKYVISYFHTFYFETFSHYETLIYRDFTKGRASLNSSDEKENKDHKTKDLLERAKQGHKGAFGELMNIYHKAICNYCYGMLNDQDEAEEITQDMFFKAYLKIKNIHSFKPYIYRIARNDCIKKIRRGQRERSESLIEDFSMDKQPDCGHNPESQHIKEETMAEEERMRRKKIRKTQKILSILKLKDRDAIMLIHYQGLSFEEAAKIVGISVSGMKSRCYRALEKFKEKYNQSDKGEYHEV